jgi:RimJ/RimL family protein N-acetyltransferase
VLLYIRKYNFRRFAVISFRVIEENNAYETLDSICDGMSEGAVAVAREVVDSLVYEDGVELALSVSSGCLVVRVCDEGRYGFLFPFELSEDASLREAVFDISEYAMREEIGLTVYGVPEEYLSLFSEFRYLYTEGESEDGIYSVTVKNECMLLEEIPELCGERVKLNAILPSDISEYAMLSRDENVNKYWGYCYEEDCKSPDDAWFYENMRGEFERGVSVSFAVRLEDRFIGEVILYAFDGRGHAELAVRLLPELHGKGYGGEAVSLVMKFAESIGLCRLDSVVSCENKPSVKLFSALGKESENQGGKIIYRIYLQ